MVVEGALEGELDDHLGYGKHDPAGRDSGNSRNGHRVKTVLTGAGPMELSVPRDRDASFEPKIVAKRQRRLTGLDELVISLPAKGLTHGEICAHLAEVYGAEVSKQTISTITDRVMDGMAEWQNRPLDAVYAVLFIDAINVKIREGQVANRPVYLALGVTADGERGTSRTPRITRNAGGSHHAGGRHASGHAHQARTEHAAHDTDAASPVQAITVIVAPRARRAPDKRTRSRYCPPNGGVAWLEFHRQTLLGKCSGLIAGQLRQRTVEPSSLSLLGLAGCTCTRSRSTRGTTAMRICCASESTVRPGTDGLSEAGWVIAPASSTQTL